MRLRSACCPGFREEQVEVVGNTALAGALLALVDRTTLEEMEELRVPGGGAGVESAGRVRGPIHRPPFAAVNDFPAIPLLEHRPYDRIRELYLYLEPSLMAAIRRGDRGEARRLINQVLVHIYSVGEERSDLLKGLLLELVVMMSRAAIEAGGGQSEVLGMNFRFLTRLADHR